jgi:hypothetical protein
MGDRHLEQVLEQVIVTLPALSAAIQAAIEQSESTGVRASVVAPFRWVHLVSRAPPISPKIDSGSLIA